VDRLFYAVAGQYQGRYRELRVIGDKKGDGSSLMIQRDPTLLPRLEARLPMPLRILYVTRNPFDNISTAGLRGRRDRPLGDAVAGFKRRYAVSERIREQPIPGRFLDVRSGEFVADPTGELDRICSFMELGASRDYLEACANIVNNRPSVTRGRVEWSDEAIEAVNRLIDRHDFLAGYSFEH